jgi:hypothetical protein
MADLQSHDVSSLVTLLLSSEKARFEAIQARHASEDELHKILGIKRRVRPSRTLAEQKLLDALLIASIHPSTESMTLALLASQRARFEAVKARYSVERQIDAAAAKRFQAVRRVLRKIFRG